MSAAVKAGASKAPTRSSSQGPTRTASKHVRPEQRGPKATCPSACERAKANKARFQGPTQRPQAEQAAEKAKDRLNMSDEARSPEKGSDPAMAARLSALEQAFGESGGAGGGAKAGGCGGGAKAGGCGGGKEAGEGEKAKDPNDQVMSDVVAVMLARSGGGDPKTAEAKLQEDLARSKGKLRPEVEMLAQASLKPDGLRPEGPARCGSVK